jgi:hypothetical protein
MLSIRQPLRTIQSSNQHPCSSCLHVSSAEELCMCMHKCRCGLPALQELLQMVPQPVLALLLLFPLTREAEQAKDAEEAAAGEQRVANTRCAARLLQEWQRRVPCDACRAAGIAWCSMQTDSMPADSSLKLKLL